MTRRQLRKLVFAELEERAAEYAALREEEIRLRGRLVARADAVKAIQRRLVRTVERESGGAGTTQ